VSFSTALTLHQQSFVRFVVKHKQVQQDSVLKPLPFGALDKGWVS